ncbi:putative RDD family membrane protein YckC [Alkalibacillus filiformis]|uniref:RDD family membrane protein YckC n=1 Tax=Alkalibacillus filiformis TaxID=200990 RepID=A0ABU0DU99_9BACI|nr:RDD family protein [Alkalibacillus filiformis]MDQ0352037.1 putative RDD family membrane protein YckC [Alkalibacillus filiformis]
MSFILRRLTGGIIDHVILTLVIITIVMISGHLTNQVNSAWQSFYTIALIFIIYILYGLYLENKTSQTIGKRVMKLQVVDSRTGSTEISTKQLVIRNIFRPIDYVAGWGVIPIILFRKRLGEFISKTEVKKVQ